MNIAYFSSQQRDISLFLKAIVTHHQYIDKPIVYTRSFFVPFRPRKRPNVPSDSESENMKLCETSWMKRQLNFASKCSPGSLIRPPRPRFSSVPTTLNLYMLCIRAQTACCLAEVLATENIILTQILAHYLQQPSQDRGRVAIEKKACHVFPAKNCHFHNVVRVSMNFLYKTNSLVYSFCGTCYLWNSVSSCFCSAAIPRLIKSITWRHSIKKVNGMAK